MVKNVSGCDRIELPIVKGFLPFEGLFVCQYTPSCRAQPLPMLLNSLRGYQTQTN